MEGRDVRPGGRVPEMRGAAAGAGREVATVWTESYRPDGVLMFFQHAHGRQWHDGTVCDPQGLQLPNGDLVIVTCRRQPASCRIDRQLIDRPAKLVYESQVESPFDITKAHAAIGGGGKQPRLCWMVHDRAHQRRLLGEVDAQFAGRHVPNLDLSRRGSEKASIGTEGQVPDQPLVSVHRADALFRFGVPELNERIVRGGREPFAVGTGGCGPDSG